VKVIAGEALGTRAVIETRTPILLHDWTLQAGAEVTVAVPPDFNAAVYVFEGSTQVEGREVGEGQLAVLGEGDSVRLEGGPARLLLLGGRPLKEPIARYGPFVMNTEEEIHQAVRDFQSGKIGAIAR
jgi:redox-sensitive bicupin YhaK (pirin superfamily)